MGFFGEFFKSFFGISDDNSTNDEDSNNKTNSNNQGSAVREYYDDFLKCAVDWGAADIAERVDEFKKQYGYWPRGFSYSRVICSRLSVPKPEDAFDLRQWYNSCKEKSRNECCNADYNKSTLWGHFYAELYNYLYSDIDRGYLRQLGSIADEEEKLNELFCEAEREKRKEDESNCLW